MAAAGPGILIAVLLGSPTAAAPTPPAKVGGPALAQPPALAGQKAPVTSALAGVFTPQTIRTTPFLVTGTGALGALSPFTPVSVRTAAFTATGTGALEATPPFSPLNVRTTPFIVTGTSALKEKP